MWYFTLKLELKLKKTTTNRNTAQEISIYMHVQRSPQGFDTGSGQTH